MARTMPEKNTGVYRTVVKTTYLEDSKETGWYTKEPINKAGDSITQVFGPYGTKAANGNYSYIPHTKRVQTGVYDKGHWKEGQPMYDYVPVTSVTWECQELRPVLALNSSGSLELALDWVTYEKRGM